MKNFSLFCFLFCEGVQKMPIMLLMTVIVSGSRHSKYNTNRFFCVYTKYFSWVVIVSYFALTRQHRHHSDSDAFVVVTLTLLLCQLQFVQPKTQLASPALTFKRPRLYSPRFQPFSEHVGNSTNKKSIFT